MLPEMIARYRRDFPATPLELNVGNSQDVIVAVADFRVDLGLIEGPCHMPELVTQPWLEDELVVFAAPDNPLTRQPPTLEALANALGSCASAVRAPVRCWIICCWRTCRISSW